MQKIETTITFTCPECRETFEFDMVGEYQLVPCPFCGTNCITVKRGESMLLKCFDFSTENPSEETEAALVAE